jgi:pimeloyl-ACP methyl ester carboxylesterase
VIKKLLSSALGKLIIAIIVIAFAIIAFFGYQIYHLSSSRKQIGTIDPSDFLISYEEVYFKSTDGTSLTGWFLLGQKKGPVLMLCHEIGSSKLSLLSLAIALQKEGFNIFLFDFRNSGESRGKMSSFGILEARDVIGAIDYLITRKDVDVRRMGILGVGMGAYSAVLAAHERESLKVLALDSIYPDIKFYFTRHMFKDSEFGMGFLTFVPLLVYSAYFRVNPSSGKAYDILRGLTDRDILLLVEMGDRKLMNVNKDLYLSLKETRDSEKNLLEMEQTLVSSLYGDQKKKYEEQIIQYFKTYLPVQKP